jgi:hypothetical protein
MAAVVLSQILSKPSHAVNTRFPKSALWWSVKEKYKLNVFPAIEYAQTIRSDLPKQNSGYSTKEKGMSPQRVLRQVLLHT